MNTWVHFWCENEAQKESKIGWLDSIGVLVNVNKKDESVKLMTKKDVGNVVISN